MNFYYIFNHHNENLRGQYYQNNNNKPKGKSIKTMGIACYSYMTK